MGTREEHDRWLRKNNCHPDQIKDRKKTLPKISSKPKQGIAAAYYADMANTVAPPVLSNTIWDRIEHGETQATINEIHAKASRCLAPYSKGSLQYLGTNKDNLMIAGKKI